MKEKLNDPFFIQSVRAGEEIVLDLDQTFLKEKILLECISCKKGFDVNSRKNRKVPSLNYCGDCYNKMNC